MQKKALVLSLLVASTASAGAMVSGVVPVKKAARVLPAVVQAVMVPRQAPEAMPAQAPARAPSYSVSPALSSALARWNSLRQSDNQSFSSYASFLQSYRGWPGEAAMRRSAERAIQPDMDRPTEVVSFFNSFPPLTPTGHAKHASALLASGRTDEARTAARAAWTGGALNQADETRLLGTFGGSLTQVEHDARMEALLGNGDTQSAARLLPFASAANRPIYEARLALQTRAGNANDLFAAVSGVQGNGGLLIDRANYLRARGDSASARQLLAQPYRLSVKPGNVEKFYEALLVTARAAAADGQWTTAYQIASQIDEAYAPGTDVSNRSYGERDEYTSLAWLGGNAATKLGRPADAARMYDRYARAAKSPQTRAKGFYWAARAAHGAGQVAQSNTWLEQAASSPDQFYGQLSLERLNRRVIAPTATSLPISASERAAFNARPIVEATRALGEMGRWSDQSLFVRAVAEDVENDRERLLAAELGRSIARPDLGVWVAREARNQGATFYHPLGFPEVQLPASYQQNWSLAHGITRQESSFDRAAMSQVGARGLMQLMPGTAREQAGKSGLPYDLGRLTSDPAYNVMLGSAYFQRLLEQWGGSAPLAIASYNAGAGNVRKWVRANGDPRGGTDIVRWIEDIPFSETRNYVQRVLENAVVYDAMRAQRTGQTSGNRLSFYLGKAGPG
ncbi:MAG TPA: lytic transglycosylase domain-containing protein [Allosphingosinicella sp.]|jgi:soluble lytic murein transglycosylase